MNNVGRNIGIQHHKNLTSHEKEVSDQTIGHDQCKGLYGIFSRIKSGYFSNDHAKQDKQRRSRGKCRRQESGCKNCGQPEPSTWKAAVYKCGNRMDGKCHGNRQVNQRFGPYRWCHTIFFCFQYIQSNNHIKEQITEQHVSIPEQHGPWCRVKENIQCPHGLNCDWLTHA